MLLFTVLAVLAALDARQELDTASRAARPDPVAR
jgi:hypothetical protein